MDSKSYVKKFTTVPEEFIDEFFELYADTSSTLQTDFVIRLDAVAKWLHCNKPSLVQTLQKSYKKNFDYIITKPTDIVKKDPRHNNYKLYLLTPDCFKRLAMLSHSKNAELVRSYFIEVEGLFLRFKDETLKGMAANLKSSKRVSKVQPKQGYVYIIRASEKHDGLYKIGRSKDFIHRLATYNSGRADDVEVLYVYKSEDTHATEQCVKAFLKKYQYKKYKEVYQADLPMIKELMRSCGQIGNKLVHTKKRSDMKGGYYIVVAENKNENAI